MRSEGYCLSVSQHPTSGASVRLENAVTHSVGSEGPNDRGDFSQTAPLHRPLPALYGYDRSALLYARIIET